MTNDYLTKMEPASPDWRENPSEFSSGDLEGKRENGKQKCQMFRSKKLLSQNIY